MSREIKFRAWDGEKMWTPWVYFGYSDAYSIDQDFGGKVVPSVALPERWQVGKCFKNEVGSEIHPQAIMQFTGLLDSKGKEIYEGDYIVRTIEPTEFNKMHYGITENTNKIAVIYWDEDEACFSERFEPGMAMHPLFERFRLCDSNAEVIGNIHQHPDLLP